jgi:NADH:ubiquinone oxidoreductase subunit K
MFINQLSFNLLLLFISFIGIIFNRQNVLIVIVCIELMLLSLNLNFLLFSVYLDDTYGQIFSLLILTVAASESALGLALIILYYRIRGNITLDLLPVLKN